ncbi:NAD-dependent epimerase/dehydratase family protein [Microbacterium sp. NPDC090225]|uniref:NAD-dependent epimerase/dehydratase family protein n=1 Tax=Microbacterium sp. NPDC090225 TaxID=3364207 RepID=UPI0037FBCA5E
MTKALILGGTGWLSSRITRRLLDEGAAVTCLARGARPVPRGAILVVGDRTGADPYAALDGEWDLVVDVSSSALQVARAVDELGDRAARWTFVSSVSVYAEDETVGGDETAPRHPSSRAEEAEYGAQKAAAEDAVAELGDRALIVRPGLIVGEGDPSDRFGYWAAAFARAGERPVLVPPLSGRDAQVIDVDDLAAYVVSSRAAGAVNAIGDSIPLAEMLDVVCRAAGHTAGVREASEEWLRARNVEYWMGDRSLPLWLPTGMTGFMTRRNERFLATGGALSPLEATVARVVADERARGVNRPRRAGLSRAEEEELLADLGGRSRSLR